MKLVDITIDLETLSFSTNAAIVQVGAVAWDRTKSPKSQDFFIDTFNERVDVMSCIFDGFDVNTGMVNWWANADSNVKESIMALPSKPLKPVLKSLVEWITAFKEQGFSVCLWSQGTDFDIAILKTALSKYGGSLPVSQKFLRDARTLSLEIGAYSYAHRGISKSPEANMQEANVMLANIREYESAIYDSLTNNGKEYPDVVKELALTHDALYDCQKEAVNTACALRLLYDIE